MRLLIVDDESLARERIKRIISEDKNYKIIGDAANGEQALMQIEALKPDVVLLDIRMPGMDGLEVARHLIGMDEPPVVIFTTAYDEYALQAFELGAVNYLLKPINAKLLYETLTKILTPNKLQWQQLNQRADGTPRARLFLSSRNRRGITLIRVEDIYYFRAEHKYVTVHYKEGDKEAEVLLEETLKELELEFSSLFLRVHRNCLIAKKYLQGLEIDTKHGHAGIRLRDVDAVVEISRRHLPKIRQLLNSIPYQEKIWA